METLLCAQSVDRALEKLCNIHCSKVIIDNGSHLESFKDLERKFSDLTGWSTTRTARNIGFSAGMNAGVNELRTSVDFYLFLNNDTEPDGNSLAALQKHLHSNTDEMITGFTIRDKRSGKTAVVGGHYYYPWLGLTTANMNKDNLMVKKRKPLHYIDGAAFVVRADYLKLIGGIPERNFLYFEELLLAQLLEAKTQMGFCAEAIITHEGSVTASEELTNGRKHYYALLACLNYTADMGILRLPSVMFARLVWLSILSVRLRSLSPLGAGVHAIFDFLQKRAGTHT